MRIAVFEDIERARLLAQVLREAGHSVTSTSTAADFQTLLERNSYDLLLIACGDQADRGNQLARWAREHLTPAPPMILMFQSAPDLSVAAALDDGVDDCFVGHVGDALFVARIEAVLRRAYRSRSLATAVEVFSGYSFDRSAGVVRLRGALTPCTNKEFALALILFRNAGRALSRTHLLEDIWGYTGVETRTLDAHVSTIRRKLMIRPSNGLRLSSIYGFGYRLDEVAANRSGGELQP